MIQSIIFFSVERKSVIKVEKIICGALGAHTTTVKQNRMKGWKEDMIIELLLKKMAEKQQPIHTLPTFTPKH